MFAFVVQAAGILSALVSYKVLGDSLWTRDDLRGLQIDAIPTVIAPLTAVGGGNLGNSAAATLGAGPIPAIPEGCARANLSGVVLRSADTERTSAHPVLAGEGRWTGATVPEAAIITALLSLTIGRAFALIGFTMERGFAFTTKVAATIVSTFLSGTGRFTNAEASLANFLSSLTLAAGATTAVRSTAVFSAIGLAEVHGYFGNGVRSVLGECIQEAVERQIGRGILRQVSIVR